MEFILILLSIATLLFSCTNELSTPANEFGRVRGYVYDQNTNERITDAVINFTPTVISSKSTDDGKFEILDIDTGTYDIRVSRLGYNSYSKRININGYITTDLEIPLIKNPVEKDPEGLIAYWKLDNNALDSGPFGYDGTEQGVQYVTDRNDFPKAAALFNPFVLGPNSKILTTSNIQLTSKFTICMWIYTPAAKGETDDSYIDLVSKWSNKNNTKSSFSFCFAEADNLHSLALKTESSTGQKRINSTNNAIPFDKWTHIAVTFDNGTAVFYIDGKIGMTRTGVPIPQATNLNLSIGGRQDQASSFKGVLDDIYIFDRALNQGDISKLFRK